MDNCRMCGKSLYNHEPFCSRCQSRNPNYSSYYNSPTLSVDSKIVEIDIRNCNCIPDVISSNYTLVDIKGARHVINRDIFEAISKASSEGKRLFSFVKYDESINRNYPLPSIDPYQAKQENKLNKKLLLI